MGLNVDATTALSIAGLNFVGRGGAAVCVTAISAQGTIEAVSFRGVAPAQRVAAGSLGYSLPSFSATSGDFVQNIGDNFNEQGVAGAKYIGRGWSCAGGAT